MDSSSTGCSRLLIFLLEVIYSIWQLPSFFNLASTVFLCRSLPIFLCHSLLCHSARYQKIWPMSSYLFPDLVLQIRAKNKWYQQFLISVMRHVQSWNNIYPLLGLINTCSNIQLMIKVTFSVSVVYLLISANRPHISNVDGTGSAYTQRDWSRYPF